MAFGNVYIFNLYTETGSLTDLNGQGSPAGPVDGPAKGTTAPYYVPQQAVVGRTNLHIDQLTSPLFVNQGGPMDEVNTLTINYGAQVWRAAGTIPDPPTPTLETDLWLYLAYHQAFLFNATNGALIPAPGGGAFKVQQVS